MDLTAAASPHTPQYGVSGYRIDFACAHPHKPGQMVLAIEADGASYHSVPTRVTATAFDSKCLRARAGASTESGRLHGPRPRGGARQSEEAWEKGCRSV